MKKLFWVGALIVLAGFTACSLKVASAGRRGAAPLIVRAHFLGTEQLFAAPEAAKLREIWSAKSAADLRAETLTRVALLPSFWLGDTLAAGSPNQTNLFRPLLDGWRIPRIPSGGISKASTSSSNRTTFRIIFRDKQCFWRPAW